MKRQSERCAVDEGGGGVVDVLPHMDEHDADKVVVADDLARRKDKAGRELPSGRYRHEAVQHGADPGRRVYIVQTNI